MRNTWPWIVFRIVMGLVLLGLLIGGGFAVYRIGWSHGYLAGQTEGETDAPTPGPGYPLAFGAWGPRLWPGHLLLGLGLAFLFLIVVGKALRALAWGAALSHGPWAGPPPGGWTAHGFHRFAPHGWYGPHAWWGAQPPDQAGQASAGPEPSATPDDK